MSQTKRTVGQLEQRFNNIINSRLELPATPPAYFKCKVSGTPKYDYFDVRVGTEGAMKDLYSFNVNKALVLDSPWFMQGHANAIALEQSGDTAAAEKLFNELLNASQLSYGVINNNGSKPRFTQDTPVEVAVELINVPERVDTQTGEITPAHKAVAVTGMTKLESVSLGKRKRFGADIEEEVPAAATVAANELAAIVK